MKTYRHGGNIDPDRIRLDFSVNVNPFGMPEGVREVLKDAALLSGSYPDITYRKLREAILAHEKENCAAAQALVPSRIVPGNGASELIMALARLCPDFDELYIEGDIGSESVWLHYANDPWSPGKRKVGVIRKILR